MYEKIAHGLTLPYKQQVLDVLQAKHVLPSASKHTFLFQATTHLPLSNAATTFPVFSWQAMEVTPPPRLPPSSSKTTRYSSRMLALSTSGNTPPPILFSLEREILPLAASMNCSNRLLAVTFQRLGCATLTFHFLFSLPTLSSVGIARQIGTSSNSHEFGAPTQRTGSAPPRYLMEW